MTPEDLKKLEALGVDLLDLPKVYDDISLFSFIVQILTKVSSSIGGPVPTYEQVHRAVEDTRRNFNFQKR